MTPWILAIRPKTLPAAITPVIVGTSLAYRDGKFAIGPAVAATVGALLIQILSNLANDYFDFKRGADTPDRVGPVRVTQSGLISERGMIAGIFVTWLAAVLLGSYLVWVGGWPIVAVGVSSLGAALAYTGGPFPFGYKGLGELFVFVFFGLVAVAGTYYVQALRVTPAALLAGVPIGLLCANILVVNNVRDYETDRNAGKMTLAARFGVPFGQTMYRTFFALSFLSVLALAAQPTVTPWVLLPYLLIFRGRALAQRLSRLQGPALNPLLGATAQFELQFGLLLAIGLAVR